MKLVIDLGEYSDEAHELEAQILHQSTLLLRKAARDIERTIGTEAEDVAFCKRLRACARELYAIRQAWWEPK